MLQEENAPPHFSLINKGIIQQCVPSKITWPARSPIEQVWDYMKTKISVYWFESKEQLFFFLRKLWFNLFNIHQQIGYGQLKYQLRSTILNNTFFNDHFF